MDRQEDKDSATKYFTKVVSLSLQFLDTKDKEEPELTIEEDTSDYEVQPVRRASHD